MEATLRIKIQNKEALQHIFKAEDELLKAGVSFDTGSDVPPTYRDWELDWSLHGAELREHIKIWQGIGNDQP